MQIVNGPQNNALSNLQIQADKSAAVTELLNLASLQRNVGQAVAVSDGRTIANGTCTAPIADRSLSHVDQVASARPHSDETIQGVFINGEDQIMTGNLKNVIASRKWNSEDLKAEFIQAYTSETEYNFDDWFNAFIDQHTDCMPDTDIDHVYEQSTDADNWEEKPEETPESIINERNNVEKAIRTAAQRITKPDHSGHGKGRRIPGGFKGDKHEKGQRRKDSRKAALGNNLEALLEHYAMLDGTEQTFQIDGTKKLLRKAGWSVPDSG